MVEKTFCKKGYVRKEAPKNLKTNSKLIVFVLLCFVILIFEWFSEKKTRLLIKTTIQFAICTTFHCVSMKLIFA